MGNYNFIIISRTHASMNLLLSKLHKHHHKLKYCNPTCKKVDFDTSKYFK